MKKKTDRYNVIVNNHYRIILYFIVIFIFIISPANGGDNLLSKNKTSADQNTGFFQHSMPQDSLEKRFLDPPADCRPLRMLYWSNDAVEVNQMLKKDSSLGYGGYVSCVKTPLNDENWGAFLRSIKEAKRNGAALWLYDEYNMGYPSGNAQGMILSEHPDLEITDLFFDSECTSWYTRTLFPPQVQLNLPPGELIAAKAFPVVNGVIDINSNESVDLTKHIKDRRIHWVIPIEKLWQIVTITKAFESQVRRGYSESVNSMLSKESTKQFIKFTHEKYLAKLGENIGKYFDIVVTDEPTLCPMKTYYPKVPWSPNFLSEFSKRRGYDLKPLLPALYVKYSENYDNIGKKVRHDYWLTVTELTIENYFVPLQDWCVKHGMQLTQQPFMEEFMIDNVASHGDYFRCFRKIGVPSIDILTSTPEASGYVWENQQLRKVPWIPARIASSVAELCNQKIVMCEQSDFVQNFTDNKPVSEAEIRGSYNRSLRSGINVFMTYYSYKGLTQEQIKAMHNWVGRCCTMLKGGYQVTDIGVIYPIESMWTRCTATCGRPSWETATEEAKKFQNLFETVSEFLYAANHNFTYIDSIALNDAVVEKNKLVHGNLRWKVIILPGVDTLPLTAWEKLEKFWKSGGVIISIGELPVNSETDFPSEYVSTLGKKMFKFSVSGEKTLGRTSFHIPAESVSGLAAILESIVERDVKISGTHRGIRSVHRRIDGYEVYFIINDTSIPWQGKISLKGLDFAKKWDPASGKVTPIRSGKDIPLELGAYNGTFFRFVSKNIE